MALAISNTSKFSSTPNGRTASFSHFITSGADGYLIVAFLRASGTVKHVTYDGVNLTEIGEYGTHSRTYAVYGIANPNVGHADVVITFNSSVWNSVNAASISYTGCSGIGTPYYAAAEKRANSKSLIVSEGSAIFVGAIANTSNLTIAVNGSTAPTQIINGDSIAMRNGSSAAGLSAGSINVTTTSGATTWATVTNFRLEILEAVSSSLATVTTNVISSIGRLKATSGGNVTDDGGSAVTATGICWDAVAPPDISDNINPSGSGTGSFVADLSSLSPNTTYYVRAYATNSVGTAYGSIISLHTLRRIIIS